MIRRRPSLLAHIVLFTWLLVSMPGAHAAVLGRAELSSALGDPLDVTIEFALSAGESRDRVRALLASPARHEAFGIAYDDYLRSVSVAVVERQGGLALRLTSPRMVDDFALEFIVELRTPSGAVLRAYTVLPEVATLPAQNAPPTAPEARTPLQQAAAPTAARPRSTGAARATRDATPIPSGSVHRVLPGDSLWSIARRMDTRIGPPLARLRSLRAANPVLGDGDRLAVGARLVIPELRAPSDLARMRATAAAPEAEVEVEVEPGAETDIDRSAAGVLRRARGRARVRLAAIEGPAFEQRSGEAGTRITEVAGRSGTELERIRARLDALAAGEASALETPPDESSAPLPVAAGESGTATTATDRLADSGRLADTRGLADEVEAVRSRGAAEAAPPAAAPASSVRDTGTAATRRLRWALLAALVIGLAALLAHRRRRSLAAIGNTEIDAETAMDTAVDGKPEDDADQPAPASFRVPASIDGRTVDLDVSARRPVKATPTTAPLPMTIRTSTSILDGAMDDAEIREAIERVRGDGVAQDPAAPEQTDPPELPGPPSATAPANEVSVAEARTAAAQPGKQRLDALMEEADLDAMEAWFEDPQATAAPPKAQRLTLMPHPLLPAADESGALSIAEFRLRDATPPDDGVLPDTRDLREALRGGDGPDLDREALETALEWLRKERRSHPRGRLALRIGLHSAEDPAFVDEAVAQVSALGADRDRILFLVDAEDAETAPDRLRQGADLLRMAGFGFGFSDATPSAALDALCTAVRPDLVRFDGNDDTAPLGSLMIAAVRMRPKAIETVVPTRNAQELRQWALNRRQTAAADYIEAPPDLLDAT